MGLNRFAAPDRVVPERRRAQGSALMDQTPKPSNFDLFILALSIYSLVNILWLFVPLSGPILRVVLLVDSLCTIAFLADFFLRLRRAPVKSSYFFGQRGWLDLIGSFPYPLLRLA